MATTRPFRDWRRSYPTALAIAAALRADPALLGLRTRRLQLDVVDRFGCCATTARTAVGFARVPQLTLGHGVVVRG